MIDPVRETQFVTKKTIFLAWKQPVIVKKQTYPHPPSPTMNFSAEFLQRIIPIESKFWKLFLKTSFSIG